MTANSLPEVATGRWRIRLEVDEPESRVATAIGATGTIIGLAAAGAARDSDLATAWELYSINVVAEQQGSGVADALIRTVVSGGDTMVWVLTENERAQSFYRRHGFWFEGATRVGEVTGTKELRMVQCAAAS